MYVKDIKEIQRRNITEQYVRAIQHVWSQFALRVIIYIENVYTKVDAYLEENVEKNTNFVINVST